MATPPTRLSDLVEALGATPLFGSLPAAELMPLVRQAREVHLDAGATLFLAGDPARALYLVLSGRTRAVRQSLDGKEQIIHEDGPGSTFPEVAVFDGGPYPSTVVAVEDSRLLMMPKEAVLRFCLAHPEVALAALRLLSARLRKAAGLVEGFGLRDVSQRLCDYLLREKPIELQEFDLRHSNQEIADLIGTVREVVSRTFAKLTRRGWIARHRRRIAILDESSLRRHVETVIPGCRTE